MHPDQTVYGKATDITDGKQPFLWSFP